MAVYLQQGLLCHFRGKNLTEGCLATACFTNKQDGLTISQALLHKYCESFQLFARDYLGQVQFAWYSIEDCPQVLVKVGLVERLNLKLNIENLLNGLLDELLVLNIP